MSSGSKVIDVSQENSSESILMGNIFPEGKTCLPVQGFIKGSQATKIITKKLPKKPGENESLDQRIVSYMEASVTPQSGGDIVERLQNLHMSEITTVLTRIRANNILTGETGDLSIVQANKEVDISKAILSKLELFLITLMNVECFALSVDPCSPTSSRSRNDALHCLKRRFVETFGVAGKMPQSAKDMFIVQLRKAVRRIHPNHPVHGFLGTILYEITRDDSYFNNSPSAWFGLGADIDEAFLSKIPSENSGNRFWFSKVTARKVPAGLNFYLNTLLFATFKESMNAIDSDGFFDGFSRRGATLSDNAGAFSHYEDSFSFARTVGNSAEGIRKSKEPGEKDEYFGPASYSYANGSFKSSPGLSGGFRFGEYDSCFYEARWSLFKPHNRMERTLYGSVCSGSAKHSFAEPGAEIDPKELRDGSFDQSMIMNGLSGTTVINSLRDTILLALGESDHIGEGMKIPVLDKKGQENTALKGTIAIGENCLIKMHAQGGLENMLFIASAEETTLSGDAAKKSLWYAAGSGAKVSDNVGLGAKIGGGSFCGAGTVISGNPFYASEVSGDIARDASISGYPFEACARGSDIPTIHFIQKILEQKVKALVGSIRSNIMARNDALENAILVIHFEQGQWNAAISPEDASRIRKRLSLLLSSSFGETDEERRIREDREWEIGTGKERRVLQANAAMKEAEWKKIFEGLRSDPRSAVNDLEQFRAGKNLMDIKNWTGVDRNGNPGVSEKVAEHAMRKIQEKITEITKAISEKDKCRILIGLLHTILKIDYNSKNINPLSQSFQDAKFDSVQDDFWKHELKKFVGEVKAVSLYKANAPAKKGGWFGRT